MKGMRDALIPFIHLLAFIILLASRNPPWQVAVCLDRERVHLRISIKEREDEKERAIASAA